MESDKLENLNGSEKFDPDKIISKYFGGIDDFLTTCLSSQNGQFSFINEGSTKRKEILAKFLDIEFYDACHKAGKEKFSSYKSIFEKYKMRKFDDELLVLEEQRVLLSQDINALEDKRKELLALILDTQAEEHLQNSLIFKAKQEKEINLLSTRDLTNELYEIDKQISLLDKKTLEDNIILFDYASSKINEYKNSILINEKDLSLCKKDQNDLKGLPCTEQMKTVCPYVSKAKSNSDRISLLEESLRKNKAFLDDLSGKFDNLKILKANSISKLGELNALLERKKIFETNLSKLKAALS